MSQFRQPKNPADVRVGHPASGESLQPPSPPAGRGLLSDRALLVLALVVPYLLTVALFWGVACVLADCTHSAADPTRPTWIGFGR